MEKVTIKQLAKYCRDYIDLVSPSVMSRGGKQVCLSADIFSAEPLLKRVVEIDYDNRIVLPINLTTKLSDLSIENEESDNDSNKAIKRDIAIARDLDDIYRKFETNSYTKQLSLKFGRISFDGIPNYENDDDQLTEGGYKKADGYLFSVSILINYKDSAGQRKYEIVIDDTLIKTNISFIKNYMKAEYRDDLYKFVAIDASDEVSSVPIDQDYIDRLWTKICEYLKYSDAKNISKKPDMDDVIVALEPKANYFLSQDLSGIIQDADDDTLEKTSLASWVSKEEKYISDPIDDAGDNELFFPFAYDKYQLQVLSKINNTSLVVEGPPGTGKSQTISNILVHLAATGKKVLFVSQKDQAVRGVKDKLKSLNIPCLFGYMPDRSSRLYTDDDEKDSATYALRGISQSHLDKTIAQDPKNNLTKISQEIPLFNESIDDSRLFVPKYNEWKSLEEFDFGESSRTITIDWYNNVLALREEVSNLKTQITNHRKIKENNTLAIHNLINDSDELNKKIKEINKAFQIKCEYVWLQNEDEYIKTIGYKNLVEITQEIIQHFEISVIDRKLNIIYTAINKFKLSKQLDKVLSKLPLEMYETYKTTIFSEKTKVQRILTLKNIEKYFSYKLQYNNELIKTTDEINNLEKEINILSKNLELLELKIIESNSSLNLILLDGFSMNHFESLYTIHKETLFDKIKRRYELDIDIKNQNNSDPNLVREEVMKEKQKYNSQVKNYIKNRIAERAESYRSQRQYRSALESIARKLSKTKKAYKTFDNLKSDPFNFEAMSSVTPIWMMGLDDASRILPLKENLFDYVILDEASQCNISYTLPVMYRAKHAIFFGDTLQMRDTTIAFKSNNQLISLANKHSIPEDLQIKAEGDSVKSVMDIALINGFDAIVLKKHYRSPLELIGFSNENFYAPKNRRLEVVNDNMLVTDDGCVLKTHLIEANPEIEISSKTNLTEAYYIKNLIESIKLNERTKDKSIAVLSFFNEQAELLKRVIPDEDVKISAIEGIQGDERDIIIYSFVITSPSDKSRYIALTGESGDIRKEINEGRVNVAFSRARLQVHAVTSLDPNLWPSGIWIKKYFEYIEKHGRINRLTKSEQKFDSYFEEDVYNFLMQELDLNDYRVSTQVESCGFKIDQVITNVKTGKKLAIECDGPTHFDDGDGQVRVENDFERQFVLETAHWIFYRISYIDWQMHKESSKKDILETISNHFCTHVKTNIVKKDENQKENSYNAIKIEIPESFINEQKEKIKTVSTRSYFGRKPVIQVIEEVLEESKNIKIDNIAVTKPKTIKTAKIKSTSDKMVVDKKISKKPDSPFNDIGEIKLGKNRSIIMSLLGSDNYWFNEKVSNASYSGFTQKGFGLKTKDWKKFKTILADTIKDPSAQEKRLRVNDSTELVIHRPSSDTIDIRQYITSDKYTGWTKKGLCVTDRNAEEILKQTKNLD